MLVCDCIRLICSIHLPLHLKPSCSRKNSLKAASSLNTPRPLASAMPSPPFLGERAGALDRQICANRPSICRKPLRILVASTEEMLSKASERRDSMAGEARRDEESWSLWLEEP